MDIIVNIRGANGPRMRPRLYVHRIQWSFPQSAESTLGAASMREAAHGAALNPRQRASHRGPLPVHGRRRRGAAPRAPALAPEEALLEVVRRQRRRRPRLQRSVTHRVLHTCNRTRFIKAKLETGYRRIN